MRTVWSAVSAAVFAPRSARPTRSTWRPPTTRPPFGSPQVSATRSPTRSACSAAAAVRHRIVTESARPPAARGEPPLAVGTLILLGYLIVHAAEHVLVGHFHFGEETHHEHWVEPVVGTPALIGLLLHTLLDGV